MAEEDSKKSPIEIVSDESWKDKVKAEDARLDAEALAQDEVSESEQLDDESESARFQQLPEPSFFNVIQMFSTQAVLAMGLIPGPNGEIKVELALAKHFIDTLGMLETKTKGNLTAQEEKFFEGTLHELRMTYVDVSKRSGQ